MTPDTKIPPELAKVEHEEPHLNCCQKVLIESSEILGCSQEKAARMGANLGGGFLGRGEVCGAVTSALMAIGLRSDDPLDTEAGEDFMLAFEEKYNSLRCSDLRPTDGSHDACEGYIAWSIDYLKSAYQQSENQKE